MTRIDHAAVWVADLEAARSFYSTWFSGTPGDLYHNPRTGLRTYILTFEGGARLELMARPDVVGGESSEESSEDNGGGAAGTGRHAGARDRLGWGHVSFALADRHAVDDMASRMRQEGVTVVDGPRTTGDGYYEAALLDPEGNRVEIVAGDYRLPR